MKFLVTGATGYLGKNICQDLLAAGHEVIATGRNQKIGHELNEMGTHFKRVDLRNKGETIDLCEGIDIVIHCAALSSPWGRKEDFFNNNVKATEYLMKSARKHDVKRIIYISSTSVYFNFKDRFNIKESDPIASPPPSLYTQSKLAAEKIVQNTDIPYMILRPRGIFGEGDTTLIPRIINAHDIGRLPIIGSPDTLIDITYVGNVSQAVLCAINAGDDCCNEIYNITNGEPVKLWDTVEYILSQFGRKLVKKRLSYPLAYSFAILSELLCKTLLRNHEPPLTRYTTGLMAKSQTLSIEKAQQRLNYYPKISMQEALNRTVYWYQGELKK